MAIKGVTSDRKNNLWQFVLSEEEWVIVEELQEVLKVHDHDIDMWYPH
jgi:hypothetical protein